MSLVLLASIVIRLAAMAWSIVLLRRVRDLRMAFLTAMLALMAIRQILTLVAAVRINPSWGVKAGGHPTELPGLLVSVLAALAVVFLERFITQHRRDEAAIRLRDRELQQAQKMEAVGQLAGGIAHDFNNLLTVMQGGVQLARRRLDDPSHVERCLDHIEQASNRSAALIRQLLTFSRSQPQERRRVDVNHVLVEMQPMLRRLIDERIELVVLPDAQPCHIEGDPTQIGQLLMNLVLNAQDAIAGQGSVRVTTAGEQQTVKITVQDDGEGMSEETQTRIFEPFFTTKSSERGTGLGLAVCFSIVQAHGGEISVQSALGGGTTFLIRLPMASGEATDEETEAISVPRGDEAILVVEDDAHVREITVEILAALGYAVRHCANGVDALRELERDANVALVVADVMMPQMGGLELRRRLAEDHPALPILLMTGYSDAPMDQHTVVLKKPFTQGALAIAVRRSLDGTEESRLGDDW